MPAAVNTNSFACLGPDLVCASSITCGLKGPTPSLRPLVLLTAGNVVFDIVIGDSYFRYDVLSVGQLEKVQVIDAMWDNRQRCREELFLSLHLMHAEETHLLLARTMMSKSLLGFARAVSAARNPERWEINRAGRSGTAQRPTPGSTGSRAGYTTFV